MNKGMEGGGEGDYCRSAVHVVAVHGFIDFCCCCCIKAGYRLLVYVLVRLPVLLAYEQVKMLS